MEALLWFLLAYTAIMSALVLVWIAVRRRRSRRAWGRWHIRQRSLAFAWRSVFGRSQVKRLTYVPEPAEPAADRF